MKKILTTVLMIAMALPIMVGASSSVIQEESNPVDLVNEWIEQYENTEIDLDEEKYSLEAVNFRIALELLDLREQVAELEVLRAKDSWISSIKVAWTEHKITVQLRRIAMLIRSSEKREAITEEIATELSAHLGLVKDGVRE